MEQKPNYNLLDRETLETLINQKDSEIAYLKKMESLKSSNNFLTWAVICAFFCVLSIKIYAGGFNSASFYMAGLGVFISTLYAVYKVSSYSFEIMYRGKNIPKEYELEKEIQVEDLSVDELKERLEKSIIDQDYEYSAIIRDELLNRGVNM